jgi:hypothetical protein
MPYETSRDEDKDQEMMYRVQDKLSGESGEQAD